MPPDTLCSTCRFYPDLFQCQIGLVHSSIAWRCWIICIHSSSVSFDVVSLCTVDSNSQLIRLKVLENSIPKLVRYYLNWLFIFLSLMENNPSEKLYDKLKITYSFWSLHFDVKSLMAKRKRLLAVPKEEHVNAHSCIQNMWYMIMSNSEPLIKPWKLLWRRIKWFGIIIVES